MDPFEQSADMRLLDFQRKALGKGAPARSSWSGTTTDLADGIPIEEAPPPALSGARLLVDLTAAPKAKLVAGAVVTLSLSVQNAGDDLAEGLRIAVPIPGGALFREGSLQIDGRTASPSYADAFFGAGYLVETLGAGQRLGFVWKISVQRGTEGLVVAPRVTSAGAAVVGSSSVLLKRAPVSKSASLPAEYRPAPPEVERPFYELDAEEEQGIEAELPAPAQVASAVDTPLFVMPDVIVDEPEPEVHEAQPAPELEAPRLYCMFEQASLNTVRKLFAAESYGQIPHYILQNSLACSQPSDGADPGIRAHLSQQAGMLSRALLMHKLNKPMNVADFSTGKTGFALSAQLQAAPERPPSILSLNLSASDVDFCADVEAPNPLQSFIRIRQLAVALMARQVHASGETQRTAIESLLADYATVARASINRTFIRAKLDKNFDPFGAADPAADKIAHELIEALAAVFAA